MNVHSSAVIGPHVTLGDDVIIGPFVVIAGPTVIGEGAWIGAGAKIGLPPEVRSHPHDASWLAAGSGGVTIGSGCTIREDVQIHGGWKDRTVIGDDAFIMNQCYLAHDCTLGNGVTMASGARLGGHASIGDGANLGLGALVHQRRVVGALSMVGMGSVVTRDLPPFVKAFGNPARVEGCNTVGMRRAEYGDDVIAQVAAAIESSGSPLEADGVAAAIEWFTSRQAPPTLI